MRWAYFAEKIKREISQAIPTRSFGRNLTAAERCALEGFNGSLACEMEYESPDLAARVSQDSWCFNLFFFLTFTCLIKKKH